MTTEATSRAPAGEAGFRLLTEHHPDLALLAFDPDLRIWSATGVALAGGECRRLETTGRTHLYALWAKLFVPLPDERGAVVGGLMIARDVTDQRRAEQELLASRRQLAEAQRIAQVGSWEWDLETDVVDLSDELCRILGLPAGSRLTVADLAQVIHPADLELVMADVERLRRDPRPFAFEARAFRADGAVRSLLVRGEGVADEDGRVVRFIGTDQDITDRRRAEADRRRLLSRVYEAQEGQDRRLAADLHDGHVQSLAAIGFKLEQARLRLGDSGSPEVDELLWQVTKDLSEEVTGLRRTIGRLRPLVLVEDGLEAAITCTEAGVLLRVSDDGLGFDPDHVQVIGDIAHFGLTAMRERVEALGGRFRVTTAPGQGTVVEARLPLTDPVEAAWP